MPPVSWQQPVAMYCQQLPPDCVPSRYFHTFQSYQVVLVVIPEIHSFLDGLSGSNAVVGHHHACDILRACHRCSYAVERHLDGHRLILTIFDQLHLEGNLVSIC